MQKLYSVMIIASMAFYNCSAAPPKQAVDTSRPHLKITIVFNPESYKSMMLKKMYPTYALWVNDSKAGVLRTIYITGKAGRGKWIMASERPSSVPVWYGAVKKETKRRSDEIDSVTSATPSGEMVVHLWQLPDSMIGKLLTVYLEGNVSFDYNEFYRKDASKNDPAYNDVNGQPSLIWKSTLKTGSQPADGTFILTGHGDVMGKNHTIDPDLSKITTAKNIYRHLQVQYIPGRQ